jgi:hypothetical protein
MSQSSSQMIAFLTAHLCRQVKGFHQIGADCVVVLGKLFKHLETPFLREYEQLNLPRVFGRLDGLEVVDAEEEWDLS